MASIGKIIGWEDVIKDRNHLYTLKCMSSKGSLLVIKGSELIKYTNKDELIKEHFMDQADKNDFEMG